MELSGRDSTLKNRRKHLNHMKVKIFWYRIKISKLLKTLFDNYDLKKDLLFTYIVIQCVS